MNSNSVDGFARALKIIVESQLKARAVVLVASATDTDGTSFITSALAGSFASSGKRTAIVETEESSWRGSSPPGVSIVSASELSRRLKSEDFEGDVDLHEVTLIDAPKFLSNRLALEFAPLTHGILCAVRAGRSICAEDRDLAAFIKRLEIVSLGAVMTPKKLPLYPETLVVGAGTTGLRASESVLSGV